MKSSCNCYFCGQEALKSTESATSHGHYNCFNCAEKFNYSRVITTLYPDGRLMFAHIITLDGWQIRLEPENNRTVIEPVVLDGLRIILPHFPITPANAKEKLKLCLTYH